MAPSLSEKAEWTRKCTKSAWGMGVNVGGRVDSRERVRLDLRRDACAGGRMKTIRFLIAAALAFIATETATAKNLVMGMVTAPTGLDPHIAVGSTDASVALNLYEALTRRDPAGRLEPALAVSWETVGDTAWDFMLRDGVRFHNGASFSAEDVTFSLSRAGSVPTNFSGLAGRLHMVRSVEQRGPLSVRIYTNGPAPDLPMDLNAVAILPHGIGPEVHGDAFNSGSEAVGTGPFRFDAYVQGDRLDLVRNPEWWDRAPDWERVSLRFVPHDNVRAAALLAGDLDVMERVGPADLKVLSGDPAIRVSSAPSMQSTIIRLNFAQQDGGVNLTDLAGKPLPANPLRDLRVREALSAAINRDLLVDKLLGGMATASGQLAPAGVFGYAADVTVPEYSPAKARQNLAAAGYPAGFKAVLHAPGDRILGGTVVAEAVAQMWSHIGVPTQIETMPWTAYAGRIARQEFSLAVYPCCGSTSDAGSALFTVLGTRDAELRRGNTNYGGYGNPALDDLLARAMSTFDPLTREALQQQASRVAAQDIGLISLFQPINAWAARRPITFTPRIDGRSPVAGARLRP
jgi:peptide/nickel transport system substrate-binding protein